MNEKKLSKAQLQFISVKLPWMNLVWESNERELKELRNLVNELKSQRAFQINRGILVEQPVILIHSVIEMRNEIRKLLSQLPVEADESRTIMITVLDWLAEILDAWNTAVNHVSPRQRDFKGFDRYDIRLAMERSWKVVEHVRRRMETLRKNLEYQLMLIVQRDPTTRAYLQAGLPRTNHP